MNTLNTIITTTKTIAQNIRLASLVTVITVASFMTVSFTPSTFANIQINNMSFTKFSSVNPGQDWNADQYVFVSEIEVHKFTNPSNISEVQAVEPIKTESLMIGKPYNYPNPFSLRDGGTQIGYHLRNDAEVEIRIYDMRAHEIYRKSFEKGQRNGGQQGDNLVDITAESFNHYDLSSGIYFFVILADGDVIGKGKMALRP